MGKINKLIWKIEVMQIKILMNTFSLILLKSNFVKTWNFNKVLYIRLQDYFLKIRLLLNW